MLILFLSIKSARVKKRVFRPDAISGYTAPVCTVVGGVPRAVVFEAGRSPKTKTKKKNKKTNYNVDIVCLTAKKKPNHRLPDVRYRKIRSHRLHCNNSHETGNRNPERYTVDILHTYMYIT